MTDETKPVATFDFAAFMERVEWAREYHGVSGRDAALAAGVSVSTYNRAVLGKTQLNINNLAALAVWARLSLDKFVRQAL
jgi:transcriptional regulator with XRE-family HTH domain